MFFIFSKLLGIILSPLIWVFALLMPALRKKASKKFVIISLVVLYFFSNGFIVTEAYRAWESPMVDLPGEIVFEGCIVLGGWMVTHSTEYNRLIFRKSTDRLLQAVWLYKQGVCKKIILSGGPGSITDPDYEESSLLKKYLLEIGIPEQDILFESVSKNTYENAKECVKLLSEGPKNSRYLLITSADHMPRAYKVFRKSGLNVTPYPVDKWAGDRRFYYGSVFIPKPENLVLWKSLVHEIVGYWIYRIVGYL